MAGIYASGTIENVAVSTSANLTLAQIIAPTNQRVKLRRLSISGQGVTGADTPVTFQLLVQSTAGTSSGTMTFNKLNSADDETVQTTANKTFSAEPTAGAIKVSRNIPSQAAHELIYPGHELIINGGQRLGLRALQAVQASVYTLYFEIEE